MSKFKVGDRVRSLKSCISYISGARIPAGAIGTVTRDDGGDMSLVKFDGLDEVFYRDFELKLAQFSKSDLKSGYLVEYRNGKLRLVVETGDDSFVLLNNVGDNCNDSTVYYDNLCSGKTATGADIMRVYGLPNGVHCNSAWSKDDRPLLWECKEVKKMTVAEVCKALGYDVAIVKDGATDA